MTQNLQGEPELEKQGFPGTQHSKYQRYPDNIFTQEALNLLLIDHQISLELVKK